MTKSSLGAVLILGSLLGLLSACSGSEPVPPATGASAQSGDASPISSPISSPLMDPKSPEMNQTAPAVYKALFSTTKGDFTIEVTRDMAPKGADRFYSLVKNGFFDGARFFRVVRKPVPFMVQFGISGTPSVAAKWEDANIEDDPVKESNTRGTISFATAGPNTRSTQVFINYDDNSRLDSLGFSPFGRVTQGMDIVDQLYADYGEFPPNGKGPDPDRIGQEGEAYLAREFSNLDSIKTARIE